MSSRLLSSNTLVEGMKDVEYPDPSPNGARKRELEEQIKAGCFLLCFFERVFTQYAMHAHVCACRRRR